jgi:hypothetical protein
VVERFVLCHSALDLVRLLHDSQISIRLRLVVNAIGVVVTMLPLAFLVLFGLLWRGLVNKVGVLEGPHQRCSRIVLIRPSSFDNAPY